MPILPTDSIDLNDVSLDHKSLCTLCQNGRPCVGASNFVQKNLFYNFDEITATIYPKPNTPRSADAFYLNNGKIHLIEIKDQDVNNLITEPTIQKKIAEKLLDSIYTIKKNPYYFRNLDIASFYLLYSHLKSGDIHRMKINLRHLGNCVGVTFSSDDFVRVPIRSINKHSTHIQRHNREYLTNSEDMVLNFQLCFCDSIDETILT